MEERVQKILSRAGIASRRTAEQMIVQGRVRIDGRVVNELGAKADPEKSDIRVDGRRVRADRPRRSIVLNKPTGYLTTRSDPGGRPSVMDLLPHPLRSLFPVGRLDRGSTGLLILTNDGELAQRIAHPRYGVLKTYIVTVSGVPGTKALETAERGIQVGAEKLRVQSAERVGSLAHRAVNRRKVPRPDAAKRASSRLRVVLSEGKNREIRRLFQALGHPVLELHRQRIGPLTDRGLPVGSYRPLTADEVNGLFSETTSSPRGGRAADREARKA